MNNSEIKKKPIIKKLFTDWKKDYLVHWLIACIPISVIIFTELSLNKFGYQTLVEILILLVVTNGFFIFIKQSHEKEMELLAKTETKPLNDFCEEWEVDKEEILNLLLNGKIKGKIEINTYPFKSMKHSEFEEWLHKQKSNNT